MKCKKCGIEKQESDFYKNDRTCKECRKAMVRENRAKNIDYYREYDRLRANNLDRIQARKEYQRKNPERINRIKSEWRKRNREKSRAHRLVYYYIKKGDLTPKPCEKCGNSKTEAHHEDYSKPLDIIWLCDSCHKELHNHKRKKERL
jgi:ribosomal protein S27AE